jgi:hypothetical protein
MNNPDDHDSEVELVHLKRIETLTIVHNDSCHPPLTLSTVPDEVVAEILLHVGKNDLEVVRRVSRRLHCISWCRGFRERWLFKHGQDLGVPQYSEGQGLLSKHWMLSFPCEYRSEFVEHLVVTRRLNVSQDNHYALVWCVLHGFEGALRRMEQQCGVVTEDPVVLTRLLNVAVFVGNERIFRYLLRKATVPLDLSESLLTSARRGCFRIFVALVLLNRLRPHLSSEGVQVNEDDDWDVGEELLPLLLDSMLMWAAMNGHVHILAFLWALLPHLFTRLRLQKTLAWARRAGQLRIVEYLAFKGIRCAVSTVCASLRLTAL